MSHLRIPAAETALLVIDMQSGFVHPESGMGKSSAGTGAQQRIVPAIRDLVGFCRGKGIPVIWSQQEHYPEDCARARRVIQPHSAKQGFLPCLQNTWETELYPALREIAVKEDHYVQKHRASVFYNTNLEVKLRMLGARFLLIAGCNTEFCVESTVRDAYARDLELLIVRDCVAGIRPDYHEYSLEVMQSYFGEVVGLGDLREIFV
jgi:ureidoacrylate peracid hydrolase